MNIIMCNDVLKYIYIFTVQIISTSYYRRNSFGISITTKQALIFIVGFKKPDTNYSD